MIDFYGKLCECLGSERIKTNEDMKRHTTFRAGGAAAYFVSPEKPGEVAAITDLCRREAMSFYILGNGSNLLVGDYGYDGVIVDMTQGFRSCRFEGTLAIPGCGLLLSKIAAAALEESLTGFEFAAGIPGTLGGAVTMNAGAYGKEMKDVLEWVRVLTPQGEIKELSLNELNLGYRTSCVPGNEYIVLEAGLRLCQGEKETIRSRMEELTLLRKSKQPLEYPSAGSTFKRPEGYFAGKLIQDAGLRGFQLGGAQVSEKHCGFVINKDHATAADIMNLCREVKRRVRETSGVELEMEVKTLGIFEQ